MQVLDNKDIFVGMIDNGGAKSYRLSSSFAFISQYFYGIFCLTEVEHGIKSLEVRRLTAMLDCQHMIYNSSDIIYNITFS